MMRCSRALSLDGPISSFPATAICTAWGATTVASPFLRPRKRCSRSSAYEALARKPPIKGQCNQMPHNMAINLTGQAALRLLLAGRLLPALGDDHAARRKQRGARSSPADVDAFDLWFFAEQATRQDPHAGDRVLLFHRCH